MKSYNVQRTTQAGRGRKVVYHGLAGHFYVRGVSHVLKVKIIAEMKDRIKIVMDWEKSLMKVPWR
ncbi:MAG: cytidylate kinase family protein [Syntrophobacteraceae bacterium]